jgi:GNAT superfamily N-acetyltransferase
MRRTLPQGLRPARAYGGEVVDAPDLLWCAAGIPSAGWNRVLRTRLAPETLDARIEWVQERARAWGTAFLWHIIPSTQPADLESHLVRHGFTDGGEEPAMGVALTRLPGTAPLPDGVTIERARDRPAVEQWARTANAGFGGSAATEERTVAAASRDALSDAAAAEYYLALLDGEPVASSAMILAAGVAGIFAVATRERARGRGIGAAVTMAPLLSARERGYAVGVLQASEMGYSVYVRMGFTEQFRYRSFFWKPT